MAVCTRGSQRGEDVNHWEMDGGGEGGSHFGGPGGATPRMLDGG